MMGHFAEFFSAGASMSFAKERPEKAGGTQSASDYPATKRNGGTLTLTRFPCSIPRDESSRYELPCRALNSM
jgi:hypothetical protein